MPGQKNPNSWESPMLSALASWLDARIAPHKAMQSSKNLGLETAFDPMSNLKKRNRRKCCKCRANIGRPNSISLITICSKADYDYSNFQQIALQKSRSCKSFGQLGVGSANCDVTYYKRVDYELSESVRNPDDPVFQSYLPLFAWRN